MLKAFLGGVAFLLVVLGGLGWWLLLSGSDAPKTAPNLFPVAEWREIMSADDPAARPTAVRMVELGSDVAPGFAAQAGAFGTDWNASYGAFVIETPGGAVVVDGGIDAATSEAMAQNPETAQFHPEQYDILLADLMTARAIVLTHEHLDHVMAIARHPEPHAIAGALQLNAPQKAALGQFAPGGTLPAAYEALQPDLGDGARLIAPGVIVAPMPGHTAGSQVVFVRQQDGRELLLIGDIVWAMSNIEDLKTRPVATQFLVFDPNEDRTAIKQQVRALHDLAAAEPDLVIVPAHDRDWLTQLVDQGVLDG